MDLINKQDFGQKAEETKEEIISLYDEKDTLFDISVDDRQERIYNYLDSYDGTCSAHELGRYVFNIITHAPDSEQRAIYKATIDDDRIESIKIRNKRRFYVP